MLRPIHSRLVVFGTCSRWQRATWLCVIACLASIACLGCGNGVYAMRMNNAVGRFEQAKALGAEKVDPYDYYSAEVRLEEARRQAARAEYGTAATLARDAEEYAALAVVKARRSQRRSAR